MIRPDAARALARKLIELRSDENYVNMAATLIMIDVEADERATWEAKQSTNVVHVPGFISLADYAKAKERT